MDGLTTRRRRLLLPLLSVFMLAATLCAMATPSKALADDRAVMAHSVNGSEVTNYYTTDDAIQAGYAGKTIILDVDWNFTGTMQVADSQSITIDMNGHLITSQGNGAVIRLEENSSLTLTSSTLHQFSYTGYSTRDGVSTASQITTGGLITGAGQGLIVDGSGIILQNNSTLTLDNVAVAGNKAKNGGGIYLNKSCTLNMKNGAAITANCASQHAGGIWCNRENATINLDNATITANCAYGNGGGIYSDADATRIYLLNNSKVSANEARNGGGAFFDNSYFAIESADKTGAFSDNVAEGSGGGIYLNSASVFKDDEGSIKGLTVSGNTCAENGGGIYLKQRYVTIEGCTVKNNAAGQDGGGLYIDYNDAAVSNCTFTGNVCSTKGSSGEGGGIFITYTCNFTLTGTCTVKGNTRGKNGSADDVNLGHSGGDISCAYLHGNLEPGSSVGIRTDTSGDAKIGENVTLYADGAYFMDLDDYHIEYLYGSNELYQRKGAASAAATQVKVSVDYPTADHDLPAKATLSWYTGNSVNVGIVWLDEDGNQVTKASEGASYRFYLVTGGNTDGSPSFADSIDASKVTLDVSEDHFSPGVQDAHVDSYGRLNVTSNWFEMGYTGNGGGDDVMPDDGNNGDQQVSADDAKTASAGTKLSDKTLPKTGDTSPTQALAALLAGAWACALAAVILRRRA